MRKLNTAPKKLLKLISSHHSLATLTTTTVVYTGVCGETFYPMAQKDCMELRRGEKEGRQGFEGNTRSANEENPKILG